MRRHLTTWVTVVALCCAGGLAAAQDGAEGGDPPGEGSEEGGGLPGLPPGDLLLPTQLEPPEKRLVDFTVELHGLVLAHEFPRDPEKFPYSCKTLARTVEDYLDEKETEIRRVTGELRDIAQGLTNEEVVVLGDRVRDMLRPHKKDLREAQDILYSCLHSAETQDSPRRPLTKQMKRFHRMQASALGALIRIPR